MKQPTLIHKLTSALFLASLLFGLATWVMLPFMLYEVRDARVNGVLIDVKIKASYIYHQGRNCTLRLTFTLPDNKEVTIGDAIPGDLATCGKNTEIAGKYVVGNKYKFIVAKEKFYISQGKYWWSIVIAFIGLIPYLYLIYSIKRNKKRNLT
jgi:hypothetical protein